MTTSTTNQSRWGYHPCGYDVFLMLKRLRSRYWRTVYEFHCWNRWRRKDPKNRRGAEPLYCKDFVENKTWFKPVTVRGEAGFKVYPKTVVDHGVLALYQSARLPQSEHVEPFDQETLAAIHALYLKSSEYFPD
ncbi:MAG: hypothetical protein N2C14_10340 [Planctomycetales bacterium]